MNVFFGETGISSTSANHLCNVGKEFVKAATTRLANITFVDTNYKNKTSYDQEIPFSHGMTTEDLPDIRQDIAQICSINSFIAYMREAIKAKDELYRQLKSLTLQQYAGERYPESPTYKVPPTFDEILETLDIKTRNEYLSLEASASVIGKLIHPGGSIHDAREAMFSSIQHPTKIEGEDIYICKPSISCTEVDDLYFELQRTHRLKEACLNAIKGSIDQKVSEKTAEINAYNTALTNTHNAYLQELTNEYKEYIHKESQRISGLKIVIPNDLKSTYEFLSNL